MKGSKESVEKLLILLNPRLIADVRTPFGRGDQVFCFTPFFFPQVIADVMAPGVETRYVANNHNFPTKRFPLT
jgi:hypothetical protein